MKNKKELVMIPPTDIIKLMPLIEKYTREAHATGTCETTYEHMMGKALVGNVHIWALMDEEDKCRGICTTEFAQYDAYLSLHLITLGTDNSSPWEEWHFGLEEFAKKHGCKDIQLWGRKGWSRALDKITGQGKEKYRETYRVFSMELDYEPTE